MKVLWLCNVMMPMIAEQLNIEASNKEGWLSGLASVILEKRNENGIELAVAFPAPENMFPEGHEVCMRTLNIRGSRLACYGFREDVTRPELYDKGLEERLGKIIASCRPDMVHCFGTEYPHTLAMCRVFAEKKKLLVSIQGLCSQCAESYFADMPERVIRSATLRDRLKKDSIREQQRKFALRGEMEREAVRLAGNIAGRTEWDRSHTKEWNPQAAYYNMNETLRESFYGVCWKEEDCIPHSIFLSQGDYPVKGFHYMLKAMRQILKEFPDTKVYVAGNSVIGCETLKQKLKLSGYGRYLRKLIRENGLQDRVVMLGRLNEEQMKERYLKSHLFVCCSSVENSPNSLGEAMLLGMPCVTADVGGIPGIFTGGEDGIQYQGFRKGLNNGSNLEVVSARLAKSVIEIWKNKNKRDEYCKNARKHAEKNHNRERNYAKMTEIYTNIITAPEG
ncbi:MAG: glycosyltransferase family 4 protein [Butyrivibrio sp.]|nr:glycosyltransferase family 4 protein [Acetatifactor muris]MCM1559189.1 glycosyltransferase family 4 protein [Butyrivibrio sp.]